MGEKQVGSGEGSCMTSIMTLSTIEANELINTHFILMDVCSYSCVG